MHAFSAAFLNQAGAVRTEGSGSAGFRHENTEREGVAHREIDAGLSRTNEAIFATALLSEWFVFAV